MASGKTTFGSALARHLNVPFIDLDNYIEEREKMTVSEIFRTKGESGFREIEKETLHSLEEKDNIIIACGGGTPCFFDNMDYINSKGETVFLDASVPVLLRRLIEASSKRPIVAGKSPEEIEETIKQQLVLRNPYYTKAKIRWDGEKLESEEEINENIKDFLSAHPFVFSKSFF